MKKTRVMCASLVWVINIIVLFLVPFKAANSMIFASDEIVIQGSSVQSSILSAEDAILQNYSLEDIIATLSFCLNRPYEGNGRIIDVNDDSHINAKDVTLLKMNYKEIGNYYDLLHKMIESNDQKYSILTTSGDMYSNRVIVRTDDEYDFSEFKPMAVLANSEYKYILQFDSVEKTEECISELQGQRHVLYAELDTQVNVPGYSVDNSDLVLASNSWGVSSIEANTYASYLSNNYNNQITIAVVDTGVSNHNFLNNRILSGGYDVINNDRDPSDDQVGHGTHVSGTIVDCTPNLNISILPVKIFNSTTTSSSIIAAGIDYARRAGVDVINLSLGGGKCAVIDDSINQAISAGITVVAAAGNDNANTSQYSPAHLSNCIVVSAVDSSMEKASFSNYGQSVDVCAPGVNIKSCIPGNQYDSYDGTSMAAPHIAAAVAMIKYSGIATSPAQIESTLISTCKDLGTTGKDIYYGYGIPKLSSLVKNVITPFVSISQTSTSVYVGDTFSLSANATPSDSTIVWSSTNTSVATVSNGKITAQGNGTAKIIASIIYDGKTYSDSCDLVVKPISISISPSSKTVYQTDTFNVVATVAPSDLSVSWSSANTSIASISSSGLVTAINPGTTEIVGSVVYAGKTYSSKCTLTVKKVSVELTQKKLSVILGDVSQIKAVTSPSGLKVSWSSSNNVVATVSDGKITTKSPGSITIGASITYNGKEYNDSCALTVTEPSVKFDTSQIKLAKNETRKVVTTTNPSGQSISWSTDDSTICTIASDGTITAKKTGNTIIHGSITYAGNTYSASCNVIVGEPVVSLSKTSLSMYIGDIQSIDASVISVDGEPVLTTTSDIVWTSSNSNIVTVDGNSSVTAVNTGSATITATYYFCNIAYSAKCQVSVDKPEIHLSKNTLSLYIGDIQTITASVSPAGSTVSWSSSDSSIAMVSSGKITAVSNGAATITASFRYNGVTYSDKCAITVKKPSISVAESNKNTSIWLGDQYCGMWASGDIPDKVKVNWKSSNTSVLTVASTGNREAHITTVNGGTSTITGYYSYGGNTYSSSWTIEVITSKSVRTFFIYPSSAEDKHIIASGYASSTVFTFNANVGFVADKVTIQVTNTEKCLQDNDTKYDYIALSDEVNMTKEDVAHWKLETTFSGFDPGTYLVRCQAYYGSNHAVAYVRLIIL